MKYILYILSVISTGFGAFEAVHEEFGSALFFAAIAIICLQTAILWKDRAPHFEARKKRIIVSIPFVSLKHPEPTEERS